MVLHDLFISKGENALQASDAVQDTLRMRYTDAEGLHFVRPNGTVSYVSFQSTPLQQPSPPTPPPEPTGPTMEQQVARMRSIFASTNLADEDITTLGSYLSQSEAVVFGSAALYASRDVSEMGGLPVGDIDILFRPASQARTDVEDLLVTLGFSKVLSYGGSPLDALWTVESCSNYDAATGGPNPITFAAVTYDSEKPWTTPANKWGSREPLVEYGTSMRWQNGEGTVIQIVSLNEAFNSSSYSEQTLVQYMADTGDFTVASGTFDGTTVNTPYPLDVTTTTYRESVAITNVDWMIYRLHKWVSRGFFVKFLTQSQIADWNLAIERGFLAHQRDGPRRARRDQVLGLLPFPARGANVGRAEAEVV